MSKCTRWVDQAVIGCKAWATQANASCAQWADQGSNQCSQWADQGSNQCSQWADEGSNQCSQWADEGSNQCSQWADDGYNQCCDWWPCSWACDAVVWVSNWVCQGWYWVANWVCQGWYWVANWVCQAWYWVANWVCQAWYRVAKLVCTVWFWIVKVACTLWGWFTKAVCVAWGNIICALNNLRAPFRKAPDLPRVQKIFVLMLENRSFDHMLGFANLTGVDPLGAPTTAEGFAGKDLTQAPFTNPDPAGGSVSVSSPAVFKVATADGDPGHEFKDVLLQLTGTQTWDDRSTTNPYPRIVNTGFVAAYRNTGSAHPANIMQCFTPDQVPVITALAREFAVCDRWFASMPGPTWPNRFFLHAASSGGLDDSPKGSDAPIASLVDGYRFANGTVFDLLDASCIDWRIFEGDEFPQVFAISGMDLNALEGRYTDFEEFASDVADPNFGPRYVFIEPSYGNILPTTAGDFTCGTSQHPLDDVTRGERLIKQVYEAIRSSPHWETSALIITYDEHGGFFDAVAPPPTVSPGDPISTADNNQHNFQFNQLGVRVPAVIVSPLIPRGTIDHTRYDHTSVARTLELLLGLKPLTARDAAANDLLHLFSLGSPRTDAPSTLPEPAKSGFTCKDAILTSLTDASDELHRSGRKVPSSFWGFMRVALKKWLLTIPPGHGDLRDEAVQRFQAVRTDGDARDFIHEARLRVRRYHRPWDEWRAQVMTEAPSDEPPSTKAKRKH